MLSELSNTLAPLIYLVASDKRLIEQVSRAIQDADYRVRTFTNTTDFHSICTDSSNECPDVIILDMNFVDVMNTLEGNNNGPIAPWLVLSASEKIEDNLVALRSGAQYCLKKPVNNAHLIDIMDEITDRRQSRVWHVLIISEKPDTFQKQIRLLQESDIIVQFSSEPLKTVELIENFNPDLILLDMAMEDPSAIELSNLLHGIDGNISVVFLGNETDALHESELYDAGVGELLLKTLSDVDFVSKVRACAKKERHYKIKHRRLESDIYKREREHQTLDYHAIVSIADRAGNITYVNDRFCEVSGYSREELLGKNHRIVKSDLHSSYFYEQMWHTISNGHIWQGEVCNRCKDGGYYWVESTITPFLDSNNKPYQYVSIRTDVTNLKNLELALEVNNERFRRSQGFANIGTWDWNIQTGELYWSQQIAPLFGYPLGDLETSYENFIEAVHPDDRELITSAITNCIEHKVDYHVEHRAVWPTGEIRWLLEKGDVIRDEDGNALNMLGVVQDITDRKMAEEALRESEEKYRCLFELSEEPMWLIVEDHFMMANRAAAQILGYESEQQLIDIHPVQLSPEYQPDGQSSLDKSKEYLATAYKQGYYRFEWTHKNISGESFPVEVSLTRIPYQGKQALFCVWRDISQRKIAEQKLLDSTTKLIEAQSLAHIGNWQADLITGGLEWSDEIFQIFGYQPGSIEPSIEVFHEAVHPDDREKVRQSERQAEITGHHDVIHRIIRPDGSIRHVQELAHAETDETGKLVKLSGTVQDITERVETETKLDETENRFSFAIEGAGDGVWDWDIPSGSMLLSGCYEKMLGFEKGELEQTIDAWQKSVHPNDIQRVQENLQAYFAGNVPHYSVELRLRCKDGSYRWILCRAETVSNDDSGKPQRMIGVHTDITDRKLMQDDIVRQKSMLDVLYQATTEFIVSGDLKTTMKNMLHYLLEITESDYGFIGQVFYDDEGQPYLKTHSLTDISWDEPSQELYNKALETGFEFHNLDTLFGHVMTSQQTILSDNPSTDPRSGGLPKGHPALNTFMASPILYGDELMGMYGIANRKGGYDIEMEQFLRPFNVTCSSLIYSKLMMEEDDRNKQALIKSKEAAEKANLAKSEFLSSMSHELRTPLNAILGFSQLMKYDNNLPEEFDADVEEIIYAGQHLLELINEVLDLAKIESGQLDVELVEVEIALVIDECIQLVRTIADKKNITLTSNLLDGVVVKADRMRVKQAILNLLSNAIKYNREDGSVDLKIERRNTNIIRLSVKDTGKGIPEKRISELFEPFNRLDNEKSNIEGTGIGLTLTRQIVEMMGGMIGVESKVGEGSTFWIELTSAN